MKKFHILRARGKEWNLLKKYNIFCPKYDAKQEVGHAGSRPEMGTVIYP
jgi:hypothetical protein